MKRSIIALMTATACLVAGCGQKPETAVTNSGTEAAATNASGTVADNDFAAAPTVTGGQAFANTAAASDAFEIASSKLAANNSASAGVKKFATQMIAAHTESTVKLKSTASALSPAITPDATLSPEQQGKVDALKAAKGGEFDTAYIADQVGAHEQALQLLQTYGASGDVAELKQFAAGLAPKVAAHLNMAKGLKP
jgi:putative membrane protein